MSETTWESIVQNYKTRAVRDGSRIDELRQSTEHWHDTAQMLKRQRDTAEEERDGWKERAMQSEQQRQSLRDLLIIAEGQRDEWKIRAIKVEQERQALWDKCEALRKDALRLYWLSHEPVFEGFADSPLDVFELESIVAEQNGRSEPTQADRLSALITGETHE